MVKKREHGQLQPYIPFGPFQLRIPFYHFNITSIEIPLGLIMCAANFSLIPLQMQLFDIPFEMAVGFSMWFLLVYAIPLLLGVSLIPGLLTPCIPLILIFLQDFATPQERIYALISLQLGLAVILVALGATGLGKRLVQIIPDSIRAGIILGAGLAAFVGEFKAGGRFLATPVCMTVATVLLYIMVFSPAFKKLAQKNPAIGFISKFSIIPSFLVAYLFGVMVGELSLPEFGGGLFTPAVVPWGEFFSTFSVFWIGFPPVDIIIKTIPMMIVAYILMFGDILVGNAIVTEANKSRPDEKIDLNPSRTHLATAIRNLGDGLFSPILGLSGPLWTGLMAVVADRYKDGRKAMDSIFSGWGGLLVGLILGNLCWPLVCFFRPGLNIALFVTLVATGFVCMFIAMNMIKNAQQAGVAGTMTAVILMHGAGWGLLAGLVAYFIVEHSWTTGKTVEKVETLEG